MKKIIAFMAIFVLVLSGCGSSGGGDDVKKVGIAMPTKTYQRWIDDGNFLKETLEEKGYEVDLQYANDDIPTQVSQVENMIANGSDVLVIAASDGSALTGPLQEAADNDIPVISYDRLLTNTDNVTSYVTFDNVGVGRLQGQYIVDKLGLDLNDTSKTYNMEIAAGAETDSNSLYFYNGAMEVLQPYIDAGIINVPSGQIEFSKVSTLNWESAKAQERMENILTANYSTGEHLDIVLASADGLSYGVLAALEGAGYTAENMPIITGQDAETMAIKNILDGKQTMSIFKDTRALASKTVEVIEATLNGEEVEYNDTETYDNGNFVVPTITLDPQAVDADNYQELLIDSGYYTEDELK